MGSKKRLRLRPPQLRKLRIRASKRNEVERAQHRYLTRQRRCDTFSSPPMQNASLQLTRCGDSQSAPTKARCLGAGGAPGMDLLAAECPKRMGPAASTDALWGGAADSIRCAYNNSFGWFSVLRDTRESERVALPFPNHWAPPSRDICASELLPTQPKRGTDPSTVPPFSRCGRRPL